MDYYSATVNQASVFGAHAQVADAHLPPTPPCAWSADDCYPAHLVLWLQRQAQAQVPANSSP